MKTGRTNSFSSLSFEIKITLRKGKESKEGKAAENSERPKLRMVLHRARLSRPTLFLVQEAETTGSTHLEGNTGESNCLLS